MPCVLELNFVGLDFEVRPVLISRLPEVLFQAQSPRPCPKPIGISIKTYRILKKAYRIIKRFTSDLDEVER
jgi:hypothetical protein